MAFSLQAFTSGTMSKVAASVLKKFLLEVL